MFGQQQNKNPSIATFYTNRALGHMKLKNWEAAADDCRRSLELDPNLIKGHFFLGQALLELEHYDEAIVSLQRGLMDIFKSDQVQRLFSTAQDLAKDSKKNYGDEIVYQIRLARKKRWNVMEEKRIGQEIELQSYLNLLILRDKEAQLQKLKQDVQNKEISDEQVAANLKQMIDSTFDERLKTMNDLFAKVDDRRKVGYKK